ncbi:unnamed protein product [Cylindrotheca closterium]|uniref:Uncharacterized protein n=1 Tax=Cylindrotheca closterium TaxID=2856 RepID=A0AAD2FHK8_9STRA|nr:unnamed protein product [Cylindrotheca closterium]
MARSEEALKRRAEKRERSVQEQKQAEFEEMKKKQRLLEQEKVMFTIKHQRPFAPRSYDRDARPPPKKQRHDPETSKALVWAEQAKEDKLVQNQALRKKYQETGGEGMDPEELERAKLLIARDERKKQKKAMKKERKSLEMQVEERESKEEEGDETKEEGKDQETSSSEDGKKSSQDESSTKEKKGSIDNDVKEKKVPCKEDHDAKSKQNAKSKRDRNKALRARFQETAGKGMSKEDIRRAKQLLERDERKKQKRASALEKQ